MSEKKNTPPKRKRSKPFTEDDYQKIYQLAAIQCTMDEIARVMGVPLRTLHHRKSRSAKLRELIEKGRADSKVSLRKAQYQQAMQGNKTMLVWLGKQWLGQTDKTEYQPAAGTRIRLRWPEEMKAKEDPEDIMRRRKIKAVK